ncbi:NAD(P)-dependent oxidoreductase [Loigolactobacillus iwatensis]|uniref:NAD(P)-dependent oxidoreductase n=1 Tax=Loigolactobacillus iwatensis TaxID=1267156 RepID=UPI000F7E0577|nr:NAD(P)H-binding protein [Loigolactobacillus iwatensis]
MQIGIIGATGNAGSAIFKTAEKKGHTVTAIVRNKAKAQKMFGADAKILEKDALALTYNDLHNFDYVIDAFASPKSYQHLDLATQLITEFREDTHTTLLFILGSSSLRDEEGNLLLDSVLKRAAGQPWIGTPIQQTHEYNYLKWVDNVKWTAVSPQIEFVVGPATSYRLGTDNAMTDSNGKATVSTGNFAAAIVAEIEEPTHLHQRFTVVNN